MRMGLRVCIPSVIGRGAGLGNELIPWCRSHIAATVLGARLLPPAFGMNSRKYWRHFGTPRYDWMLHRLIKAGLPNYIFTQEEYEMSGALQAEVAIEIYAKKYGLFAKRSWVLSTSGMWGGFRHIAAARQFANSVLFGSRYAAKNLLKIRRRIDEDLPLVGVHVRLSDFKKPIPGDDLRGRFNVSLPISWYESIMARLDRFFSGRVQYLIVSDGSPEELYQITKGRNCISTFDIGDGDCSDLLALSSVDLLVCSVSSYSAWAGFLGCSPYIWFRGNMQEHDVSLLSIWGHEESQQKEASATRIAIDSFKLNSQSGQRGWPLSEHDELPTEMMDQVETRLKMKSWRTDILQYGVVRG